MKKHIYAKLFFAANHKVSPIALLNNQDLKHFKEQRKLIKSCGNSYKHKIQKVVDNWLDMFSIERKLSDDQMECIQFGICDYAPRQVHEVPFFHY